LGETFHLALVASIGGAALGLSLSSSAGVLVPALYGERLRAAAQFLRILALTLPAVFLGSVLISRLVAEGRQRRWTLAASIAAATNVMLNFLMIPRVGARGAAAATLVTEWTMVALVLWSYRRHELRGALYWSALWVFAVFGAGVGLQLMLGEESPSIRLLPVGVMMLALPIVFQWVPQSFRVRSQVAVQVSE
jgi:O-antigen/teichoic acid export membrane protein